MCHDRRVPQCGHQCLNRRVIKTSSWNGEATAIAREWTCQNQKEASKSTGTAQPKRTANHEHTQEQALPSSNT